MSKPKTSIAMLTRRCPYRCPTCLIRTVRRSEKPASYWISIAELLKEIHLNFYGGEPQVYKDLGELVVGLNRLQVSYSFSSACPFPEDVVDLAATVGLKNWTASVDSLTDKRSVNGLKTLRWLKALEVPDLMAEVVVFPQAVTETVKVAELLMAENFWMSISFLSWAKGPQYDSWPVMSVDWTEEDLRHIRSLRNLVKGYEKLHGKTSSYLDLWDQKPFFYQKLKPCNGTLIAFHPDCDGSMRLCRDIAGDKVRKWDAKDAILNWDRFHEDWVADYHALCLGCNWACAFWTRELEEEIKHAIL